jgi:hypothetical protein
MNFLQEKFHCRKPIARLKFKMALFLSLPTWSWHSIFFLQTHHHFYKTSRPPNIVWENIPTLLTGLMIRVVSGERKFVHYVTFIKIILNIYILIQNNVLIQITTSTFLSLY